VNPSDSLELLARYGAVILPILVVAEQVGVPLPAVPALLGVGALAANGRGSVPLVLGAIAVVALVVDLGWYEVGRRRGAPVLARLCRLSLEPDSCVRRTQDIFIRYGVRGMLFAKFVPGLTTVMPPLAGVFAVGRLRFVVYEILGVLLWSGLWTAVGYAFSDAITTIVAHLARAERVLLVSALLVAGYLVTKWVRRWLFLRALRIARIAPGELKRRLDGGEGVTVIDVRGPDEFTGSFGHIAAARNIPIAELESRLAELAGLERAPLVLVCRTDKRSATAARTLRAAGFTQVIVLRRGMEQWNDAGLPVEGRAVAATA